MAGIPLSDIANQNFQAGSSYMKSTANAVRRAVCGQGDAIGNFFESNKLAPAPVNALLGELGRYICELPDEPVPIPPADRVPSNQGSCECLPYEVTGFWSSSSFPRQDFSNRVYGPVVPFERKTGTAPNVRTQVGYTHRGIFGGGCQSATQETVVRDDNEGVSLKMTLTSVVPYSPNPPSPIDCQRPTFPTDRTVRDRGSNPPTINLPRIDLPDVIIPVLPVPLPLPVGIEFEPKLVFDVGGINVSFTFGDVEFSFNPNIDTDITLFPPGYQQPTLPPSVEPLPPKGGKDCCDAILQKLNEIDSAVTKVDLTTQSIEDDTDNIKTVQNTSVVPLLKDVQECVCEPPTELFQSFTNVRAAIFPPGEEEISFAVVRLASGLSTRRTFEVPGGETVSMIGYCSFGRSGRWGERIALQYQDNIVKAPGRGYNQFTASFIDQGTGNIQIFTYKKE